VSSGLPRCRRRSQTCCQECTAACMNMDVRVRIHQEFARTRKDSRE
jgi:hypothetical protein